ncbi:MAG: DNA mismatch repair protein MutT [Phenylobacterium sp. RIFCSPHIGHO2_01_FULL_69_31]|uniref:NUDIX domain-containing protein n=1 Tax=Phenylobacterium sp. RIFCSPHIGHO2_01_FULL_69_31 TaxID=1801944 RepID=UPI0008BA7DD0|nr:NUDIX domain-containing protein [Phenylobacterium sp. RIFCSPHIGHO2_01_FULL_69_31]OHB26447.1 MAG: DNA mismatch repair protein MutT [Phenylobacterium sp. RIFCSPHIGHO2_01_FULL_69_31]
MAVPQFGTREDGRDYRDRPAAFGIAQRDGRIALVRIEKPRHPAWHDLPGGALDPGETAEDAVVREFGEEAGLKVAVEREYARADQYFLNTDGEAFDNRAVFFTLAVAGDDPGLKVEDDHTLVWMDPHEALAILRHDAHAWAVAAWLRLRARA